MKTWIEDAELATVRSPNDLERPQPDEGGDLGEAVVECP